MKLGWLDIVVIPCAIFGFAFALWGFFDFSSVLRVTEILFPVSILIPFCYFCAIVKVGAYMQKDFEGEGVSK